MQRGYDNKTLARAVCKAVRHSFWQLPLMLSMTAAAHVMALC